MDAGNTTAIRLSNGARLEADLVIDASCRGGGTDRWLSTLNGRDVLVATYRPEIRYASAFFSRRMMDGPDYGGWLMFTPAPGRKGAVALPVENDRWLITGYTRFEEPVPMCEEGFRAFLHNLSDSKIASLIEGETVATPISTYALPKVRFRRFDLLTDALPIGCVPVGDTIATFSPINAQGMSVAALQAKALNQVLTNCQGDTKWRLAVSKNYVTQAAIPTEWAWNLCQAFDAGFNRLRGSISSPALDLSSTIRKATENASAYPKLVGALGRMIHLLKSPSSFLRQVRGGLDS